jgi:pimeloyl-ACP methyl ester carboxylesterase
MDRNWHRLADIDPVIHQPALMIYGDQDTIPRSANLTDFVPNVDVIGLDCGHWVQQEKPEETIEAILSWLRRQDATPRVEPVPSASAVGGGR